MKIISAKSIEEAFNFFENEGDEKVIEYNKNIFSKHENIIEFIAGNVDSFFQNEDDFMNSLYDLFYYLALFIKSFENEGCEISKIDDSIIDNLSHGFPDFLEEYMEDNDPNTILNFVNQPYLTDFLLYELSEENEENEFDDNQSNLIFMTGVSLMYILDKASSCGKE